MRRNKYKKKQIMVNVKFVIHKQLQDIREAKDHVEKLKAEIEGLQRQLYDKDRSIRDKDVQLRKISDYEAELETLRRAKNKRVQRISSWK
jgi:predicted RNase H-like nuclease (RuvC/YqgF family)